MADGDLCEVRYPRDEGRKVVHGEVMACIHFEAMAVGGVCGEAELFKLACSLCRIVDGAAIGAGLELDPVGAGADGWLDLVRVRIAEKGDARAGLFQPADNGLEFVGMGLEVPAMVRGCL